MFEFGPQCFILDTLEMLYYRYVTNCEMSLPVKGSTHFHLQLGQKSGCLLDFT